MKRYLIGYALGILTILGLLVVLRNKYPEWFIKKITETKTEYKDIHGDPKVCGEMKIYGEFFENKLLVTAEDDCKIGTSTFTLGVRRSYKQMIQIQFVNAVTSPKSYKNYGADISYTYFISNNFGLTAGLTMVPAVTVAIHGGFSFLW